jgi:hypothetical protein
MAIDDSREKDWICDQFNRLLAAGTPAARTEYLLEHPVLLSGTAMRIVQLAAGQEPMTEANLMFLDDARKELWAHPEKYPPGHGPLEQVIADLRAGDIDLAEAIERAKAPDCAGQLSHTFVRALLWRLGEAADDDVTFALGAAETVVDAAWAMPWPSLASDVRRAAAEGFIRLVHRGVMRRPDGRLYARALEVGDWGLKDAEKNGNMRLKGAYLHWLGTLSLDAYGANVGVSPDYRSQVEVWLAKAIDPMPDVLEGLAHARRCLTEAVDLRPAGSERGQTLKALVETIVYEAFARGTKCDVVEITALSDRALDDLDAVADERAIGRLLQLRGLAERSGP